MTEYIFRGPNTARAMDRVQRELGNDAYILSIRNAGGQVEIRATTEAMAVQAGGRNSPARIQFARYRAERTTMPMTPSPLRMESLASSDQVAVQKPAPNAQDQTTDAPETPKIIHFAQAFRAAAGTPPDTANTDQAYPGVEQSLQDPVPHTPIANPSAKDVLQGLLNSEALDDAEADGSPWTNQSFRSEENMPLFTSRRQIEPQIATTTSHKGLPLHAADLLVSHGFSADFVATMPDPVPDMDDSAILADAVARLAHDLAPDDTRPSPLEAPMVFVWGAPGSGKSLLAAKIAQSRHSLSGDRCRFIETRSPVTGDRRLRAHAQIMGLEVCDSTRLTTGNHWDGRPCVVEIASATAETQIEAYEDTIPTRVAEAASRVLTLPATWSTGAISRLLAAQENDRFTVAITQMDLANVSVAEFCTIWSHGVRIMLLGRGEEITNGLAEVSEKLIADHVERAVASAASLI